MLLQLAIAGCADPASRGVAATVVRSEPLKGKFTSQAGGSQPDSLYPLYPNPFNRVVGDTAVHITFSIKDTTKTLVLIQNPIGEEVVRYEDSTLGPGSYSGMWNGLGASGQPVNPGIYFITLRTEAYISSRLLNISSN